MFVFFVELEISVCFILDYVDCLEKNFIKWKGIFKIEGRFTDDVFMVRLYGLCFVRNVVMLVIFVYSRKIMIFLFRKNILLLSIKGDKCCVFSVIFRVESEWSLFYFFLRVEDLVCFFLI